VKVDAFYENILIGDVHADLSCCRKIALEHQQKGDSDQDDGDESEDSDGGDGGPPENLDISQDDKILTNEDEFSDVEEDVLNLIDEMLDSHISEHTNDVLKQTVIEFNDTPVEDIAKLFQKLVQIFRRTAISTVTIFTFITVILIRIPLLLVLQSNFPTA
jgi:hypothetical protein